MINVVGVKFGIDKTICQRKRRPPPVAVVATARRPGTLSHHGEKRDGRRGRGIRKMRLGLMTSAKSLPERKG